jgi:hypothetical protein
VTVNSIPQPQQPIAGGQCIDPTWYRWLRERDREARETGTDLAAETEAIARKLGSPDGTIDGIPESVGMSVAAPITLTDGRLSLAPVVAVTDGALFGISTDQWGRVIGLRPVVAGDGITIDDTADPEQIEVINDNPNVLTTLGDLIRADASGDPERLPIGTNGQVLTVVSGEPEWATSTALSNPMTTAEDLIKGGTAGAPTRLPVGSNGQVLTVTSGAVGWASPSGLTNPMTTLGDIITGDTGGTPKRLGVGTAGQVLTVVLGEPAWASAGGGSDPWTYVVLTSDFSTTANTPSNITGLSVSPVANKVIVIEAHFLTRSFATTTGVRPGISWPTIDDGVVQSLNGNASTANVEANSNVTAGAFFNSSVATANTTASWPFWLWVTMVCGASPSGTLNFTLQSEISGSNVTVKAGSWIRYRTIN